MKLTDTHRAILESSVSGICIQGVWRWSRNGEWVTRQVNTLMRANLLDATYYSGGGASTYATAEGREALAYATS